MGGGGSSPVVHNLCCGGDTQGTAPLEPKSQAERQGHMNSREINHSGELPRLHILGVYRNCVCFHHFGCKSVKNMLYFHLASLKAIQIDGEMDNGEHNLASSS